MSTRPIALTIAGSDSGGGAGIQADLKTFAVLGCFGTSAVTAVTAQNTLGVQGVTSIEPDLVALQIRSVADDLRPAATKTGMLGSAAVVETVAAAIGAYGLAPLVVDPVMIAKGGDRLVEDEVVQVIVRQLLPLATLMTPNVFEAVRITGMEIEDQSDATRAAELICREMGAGACVVTGIRAHDNAVDAVFVNDRQEQFVLSRPWQEQHPGNTHGSGCTFSAAITAGLAWGLPLREALEQAKEMIQAAIASPVRLGSGVSPVDHLAGRQDSWRKMKAG